MLVDYAKKTTSDGAINHLGVWHQAVLKIKDFSGRSVLDVGCGSGSFLSAIKNKARYCVGLDPNPNNTKFLTEHQIPVVTGYLEGHPALGQSPVDTITCFEVIEHLYSQSELFEAVFRTLVPEGEFIVSTPNAFNIFRLLAFAFRQEHHDPLLDPSRSGEPEHIRLWSRPMLCRALRNAGFESVRAYGALRMFNRVVVVRLPLLVRYFSQHLICVAAKPKVKVI